MTLVAKKTYPLPFLNLPLSCQNSFRFGVEHKHRLHRADRLLFKNTQYKQPNIIFFFQFNADVFFGFLCEDYYEFIALKSSQAKFYLSLLFFHILKSNLKVS